MDALDAAVEAFELPFGDADVAAVASLELPKKNVLAAGTVLAPILDVDRAAQHVVDRARLELDLDHDLLPFRFVPVADDLFGLRLVGEAALNLDGQELLAP